MHDSLKLNQQVRMMDGRFASIASLPDGSHFEHEGTEYVLLFVRHQTQNLMPGERVKVNDGTWRRFGLWGNEPMLFRLEDPTDPSSKTIMGTSDEFPHPMDVFEVLQFETVTTQS